MASTSSIIVSPAETLDCQDSSRGSQQDDGSVYPTGAKRMVILTSMAVATFLVALVRKSRPSDRGATLTPPIGQHNHRYRRPENNG